MEHGVIEFTNALITEVDSRAETRLNDIEVRLEKSLQVVLGAKIEEAVRREAGRLDRELNEKLRDVAAMHDQLETLGLDMRARSAALDARLLELEEISRSIVVRLGNLEGADLHLHTHLRELAERFTSLEQNGKNSNEDAASCVVHATLQKQQEMLQDVVQELTVRKQQNMLLDQAFKQLESRVDNDVIQNTAEASASVVEQRVSQVLQAHMQAQRAALEEMNAHQSVLEEKINAGRRSLPLDSCSPAELEPVEAENLAGFREQLLNLSMRMSELQHVGDNNTAIDEAKMELETQRLKQARLEKALQQCVRSGREAMHNLQTQVNQLIREAKTKKEAAAQPAQPAQPALRSVRRIKSGMRAEDPEATLTNGRDATRRASQSSASNNSSEGTPPSDPRSHPSASPPVANAGSGPPHALRTTLLSFTSQVPPTAASYGISSTLVNGIARKEIIGAVQMPNPGGEARNVERNGAGSHTAAGAVTEVRQVLDVQESPERGNAQWQTAQELYVDDGSPTMPPLVSPTMEDYKNYDHNYDKVASKKHLWNARLAEAPRVGSPAAKKEDAHDDACDFQ